MSDTTTEKRVAALEARVAKLEAAAALYEEHRQGWIKLEKLEKEWPDAAGQVKSKG